MTTRDHGDTKNTTLFAISSWGGMTRERDPGFDLGAHLVAGDAARLRLPADERLHIRAADPTRRDAVHAHAGRTELDRHRLGRGLDRRLRRRVATFERADVAHAHRDDEHDRGVAVIGGGLLQVGQAGLGQTERAPHVDLEDLAPLREVDRFELLERVHPERVVHEAVEPPVGVDGAGDESLHLLRVDEIGRQRQRPPAVALDLLLDLGEVLGVAGGEHHRRTFPGEGPGVGLAEARSDPGDDDDFVLQQHPPI